MERKADVRENIYSVVGQDFAISFKKKKFRLGINKIFVLKVCTRRKIYRVYVFEEREKHAFREISRRGIKKMVDFLSSWNWRLLKSRYFHVKFFIPLARGSCEVGIYSHRGGQVQSPGNTSQRVKESAFSDFSEKTNLFLTLCSRQVYIYIYVEKDTFLGRSPDEVVEGCPGPREPGKKKGEKIEIMGEFEFLQKTRIIMERVI